MEEFVSKNFNKVSFENLKDVKFNKCNVTECTFANLENVTFEKSNVRECVFTNSTLKNVTASYSNIINSVDLDSTKIINDHSNIYIEEDEEVELPEDTETKE